MIDLLKTQGNFHRNPNATPIGILQIMHSVEPHELN